MLVEGINGCGKTTFLKNTILLSKKKVLYYLWHMYFFKKEYTIMNVTSFIKTQNVKITLESWVLLDITRRKVESYSAGQKKKLIFSGLISSNSYHWYIDEPRSYVDDILYTTINKKIKKHLVIGGRAMFTINSRHGTNTYTNIKVSLSRFELLTSHLSNERSKPAEL